MRRIVCEEACEQPNVFENRNNTNNTNNMNLACRILTPADAKHFASQPEIVILLEEKVKSWIKSLQAVRILQVALRTYLVPT